MRMFLLVILLVAAVAAYYYFGLNAKPKGAGSAVVQRGAYVPSTGNDALDRTTGITAVNQLRKTQDVLEKVKTSKRMQLP